MEESLMTYSNNSSSIVTAQRHAYCWKLKCNTVKCAGKKTWFNRRKYEKHGNEHFLDILQTAWWLLPAGAKLALK